MNRGTDSRIKRRAASVIPGLALSLACLSGCFRWQQDSDPTPYPVLEAKARMEFIEPPQNRDSLVGVFVGIGVSHAVPGKTYRVSADVEFVGQARNKVFDEIHAAQDTVIDLSWVFIEEIRTLKGVTLRAVFKVDSLEVGRDSATYY
jgi:hypothetical protein